MKSKKLLFLGIALTCVFLVSCDTKDEGDVFSPLTVEQNKAKIEDDGIAMLNAVKRMESGSTSDAAVSMINYMDRADLFMNNPSVDYAKKEFQVNAFFKPIYVAASLKEFNATRVANELMFKVEPETLVELWNDIKGTYTWNSVSGSWGFATGNEILIKFPSTETGTTNNVSFRVYDFLYENGPFTWTEDYTGELPKQIKCELKIGQNVALTYSLLITYQNAEKKPNSIITTLELTPFKFTVEASNNNNSSAAASFKWTENTNTLVYCSLSATGNWTESIINSDDLQPGDVIYDGNATFQLMNIKLTGNVNVKSLSSEMDKLANNLTELQRTTAECELINKFASLAVCYADNNQIIAKVIAYPLKHTDTYWDYYYNREVTETYYEVGIKFKFSDDSTVDLEAYFDAGFDSLINQIEDYLDALETDYGK